MKLGITTEQWSQFQDHRNNLYLEVLKSHDYHHLCNYVENKLKTHVKTVNRRFLWWSWNQEIVSQPSSIEYMFIHRFYEIERNKLFSVIPEPTIENCLNWLASKKLKVQKVRKKLNKS